MEAFIEFNRKYFGYASLIAGGLLLVYCFIFLLTCPSIPLAAATLFETAVFAVFVIAHIRSRSKKQSERTGFFARIGRNCYVSVAVNAALVAFNVVLVTSIFTTTYDVTALVFAATGNHAASINLYSRFPTSVHAGLHPAVTLEMLTGACVESQQWRRAEKLYLSVMQVRSNVLGPRHPLVAAIFTDLGDMHTKMGEPAVAETRYRQSIAMTEGRGRAFSGLGKVLALQNKMPEAKQAYARALAIKERYYGRNSEKYLSLASEAQAALSTPN